ncbi:MAG: DUF4491 family protein [Duncaniella sp.]|nr:DUF4491 family protein [Duncaniella sp.]
MTSFLMQYHLLGLTIGLCTFLIIGLFHPVVIKCEYHFGAGCRWWFAVAGTLLALLTIVVDDPFWSSLLGVTAFSSLWSVHEIAEQQRRVERGWFPQNPKRKKCNK